LSRADASALIEGGSIELLLMSSPTIVGSEDAVVEGEATTTLTPALPLPLNPLTWVLPGDRVLRDGQDVGPAFWDMLSLDTYAMHKPTGMQSLLPHDKVSKMKKFVSDINTGTLLALKPE
jgi:hypothetical protein